MQSLRACSIAGCTRPGVPALTRVERRAPLAYDGALRIGQAGATLRRLNVVLCPEEHMPWLYGEDWVLHVVAPLPVNRPRRRRR